MLFLVGCIINAFLATYFIVKACVFNNVIYLVASLGFIIFSNYWLNKYLEKEYEWPPM